MPSARKTALLGISTALLLALSFDPAAAGNNKGKKHDKGGQASGQTDQPMQIAKTTISALEREIIESYIGSARASSQGLPPGLAKREQLPPGLAKQIERNGALPPGLGEQRLPDDLLAQLPKQHSGHDYRVVGGDIVLVDLATRVIVDVIKDVLH